MILDYLRLVVGGYTLGVLGLDHVQQLLIDLLLLLLQPHIDIHLPQRDVVTCYAGADGQPLPSQQGIALLGRRLDRLDATAPSPDRSGSQLEVKIALTLFLTPLEGC